MNTQLTLGNNQLVKNIIKNFPEFLANYQIISTNLHTSKFGDAYQILAVTQYNNYSDIICTPDNEYLRLGSERYKQTLEIIEQLSLLKECDRTLKSVSSTLVA